jgi:hypothetical protein
VNRLETDVDPSHRAPTPEIARVASLQCYVEALLGRTTSVMDMWRFMDGSAGVAAQLGIRATRVPYMADAPGFDYFETIETSATGILFCFTPLSGDRARVDIDLLFQHPDGFTEEQLAERLAFEIKVVGEDMTMQGLYDFLELPLVLTDEVHTRADKAAVEMRRIVGELLSHSQR